MDSSRFVVLCLGIPGSKGKSAPFRFVDLCSLYCGTNLYYK